MDKILEGINMLKNWLMREIQSKQGEVRMCHYRLYQTVILMTYELIKDQMKHLHNTCKKCENQGKST